MTIRVFIVRILTVERVRTWLALGLLILCTVFSARTSAQDKKGKENCVPTRDRAILKSRENELRAVAEKLLQAFRAGDAKTFLGLVHPDYFSMGEDSKNYTLAELRKSFRKRDQIYCYLFDASCIAAAPPPTTPETSFSEVAKQPAVRVQSVEILVEKDIKEPGCRGSVNFVWADPVDPSYVSTFTFLYVGRQWKTVGFGFPPSAPPDQGLRSVDKPRARPTPPLGAGGP